MHNINVVDYNKCLCCNSKNIAFLIACKDHVVSNNLFDIYECNDCGFRFTQNVPTIENISQYYYSDKYLPHSNNNLDIFGKIFQYSRNYTVRWKVDFVLKTTQKNNGSLLDIGSGLGYFANKMHQEGWFVKTVEVDAATRKLAMKTFHLEILFNAF